LKNQLKTIDRTEFKEYKENLNRYDNVINNYNTFSINDINSKKLYLSKRLNQYTHVKVSDKVLYTIAFMDSSKTIKYIETTIAKLEREELELKFNYCKAQYYIKDLCELHITKSGASYIIEDIKVVDSSISYIIELFSNRNKAIHLKDKEIREKFIYAIENAIYELNIASPWMNNRVVDDSLIRKMENCLKKGTTIKIVYGMGDDSSRNDNRSRDNKSDKVAQELNDRFRYYNGRFKIKKVNSHYKLLICDEKFFLEGSYNFLSFDGKYKDDVRSEGATYNTDLKMIRELRGLYFNF
ncbi:phospholipase D-like domain-containing protein, partial [Romboutsia sp.]|uniref:phospholipase D-like domain-containing protein n=1 Tax=Romboutsia sp. TaxID=1965302 RepID=UPI003F39EF9B